MRDIRLTVYYANSLFKELLRYGVDVELRIAAIQIFEDETICCEASLFNIPSVVPTEFHHWLKSDNKALVKPGQYDFAVFISGSIYRRSGWSNGKSMCGKQPVVVIPFWMNDNLDPARILTRETARVSKVDCLNKTFNSSEVVQSVLTPYLLCTRELGGNSYVCSNQDNSDVCRHVFCHDGVSCRPVNTTDGLACGAHKYCQNGECLLDFNRTYVPERIPTTPAALRGTYDFRRIVVDCFFIAGRYDLRLYLRRTGQNDSIASIENFKRDVEFYVAYANSILKTLKKFGLEIEVRIAGIQIRRDTTVWYTTTYCCDDKNIRQLMRQFGEILESDKALMKPDKYDLAVYLFVDRVDWAILSKGEMTCGNESKPMVIMSYRLFPASFVLAHAVTQLLGDVEAKYLVNFPRNYIDKKTPMARFSVASANSIHSYLNNSGDKLDCLRQGDNSSHATEELLTASLLCEREVGVDSHVCPSQDRDDWCGAVLCSHGGDCKRVNTTDGMACGPNTKDRWKFHNFCQNRTCVEGLTRAYVKERPMPATPDSTSVKPDTTVKAERPMPATPDTTSVEPDTTVKAESPMPATPAATSVEPDTTVKAESPMPATPDTTSVEPDTTVEAESPMPTAAATTSSEPTTTTAVDTIGPIVAEGFFVTDKSVFQWYLHGTKGSFADAREYVLRDIRFFVYYANSMFKELRKYGLNIELRIAAIQIVEDEDMFKRSFDVYGTKDFVVGIFEKWLRTNNKVLLKPGQYDFAMIFSRYSDRHRGFSFGKSVCGKNPAAFLTLQRWSLNTAHVLAQETARILGVPYSRRDAPWILRPNYRLYQWPPETFNQTSANFMKAYLEQAGTKVNCLRETHDTSEFAGEMLTPGLLCTRELGLDSYFCSDRDNSNKCGFIFCYDGVECRPVSNTEELACGVNKYCHNGTCVLDLRPVQVPESPTTTATAFTGTDDFRRIAIDGFFVVDRDVFGRCLKSADQDFTKAMEYCQRDIQFFVSYANAMFKGLQKYSLKIELRIAGIQILNDTYVFTWIFTYEFDWNRKRSLNHFQEFLDSDKALLKPDQYDFALLIALETMDHAGISTGEMTCGQESKPIAVETISYWRTAYILGHLITHILGDHSASKLLKFRVAHSDKKMPQYKFGAESANFIKQYLKKSGDKLDCLRQGDNSSQATEELLTASLLCTREVGVDSYVCSSQGQDGMCGSVLCYDGEDCKRVTNTDGLTCGIHKFCRSGTCVQDLSRLYVQGRTTPSVTTPARTTQKPTTQKPTTQRPTTPKPTTQKPTTQRPTTQKPTTQRPTTQKPTTQRPTTQKPTTQRPTTPKPTTQKPTTPRPTTQRPTTQKPTTPRPTTQRPTTQKPTTPKPKAPPGNLNEEERRRLCEPLTILRFLPLERCMEYIKG